MTPRQADLVCALERVDGVLAAYAIEPAADGTSDVQLAVHLTENRPRALAQAHYALAQWLAPYEWRRVLLFEVSLPPFLEDRAQRLVLTQDEREQAKRRAPPLPTVIATQLEGDPFEARGSFSCLVVSADPDVAAVAKEAFGPRAKIVVEADKHAAFWQARDESFDLILCESSLAFGKDGVLSELVSMAREVARHVVVLASPGAVDLVAKDLDELRALNSFLSHPVSALDLREVFASGAVVQRWSIPVLPPRATEPVVATEPTRSVLVVDDDPETAMLLASSPANLVVTVTADEWEAADALAADDLALVVCSVTLRTRGGTPFYRFLWTARPDIKSRFVFLVRPDTPPPSGAAVVTRPLTRESLSSLVLARTPS